MLTIDYDMFVHETPIPEQANRFRQFTSLRIQPPLIRSRYYVRNAKGVSLHVSHVVADLNERRLYSQATNLPVPDVLKLMTTLHSCAVIFKA